MLTVKVLGAGRHVGKSACLAQVDHTKVLFDCGIQVTNDGESRFPKLEDLFEPIQSVISQKNSLFNLQNILQKYEHNVIESSIVEFNNNELLTSFQNESNIILQEIRKWREEQYKCLVDVVLITHFHLDHIGALPYLTEVLNYNGMIFMTPATLCQAKLQLEDCWLNQNNVDRSQINHALSCETINSCILKPVQNHELNQIPYKNSHTRFSLKNLFRKEKNKLIFCYWNFHLTYSMIQSCLTKVKTLSFFESTSIGFLKIKVLPAGHVPGACMFYVEGIQSSQSILYTGDFTTDGEQVIPKAKVNSSMYYASFYL
jgi:integrator complex subunit 11